LRIAASDAEAKRGEAEGIHRLRTTTRRLRSELHSLDNLIDRRWRGQIEEELSWLAGRLGEVRDLDVLLARLKKAAIALDPAGSSEVALAPLFSTLQARRALAARLLNDALRGDRYRGLLGTLQQAAKRPALTDAASQPCRVVLPAAACSAWRRLKKAGRGLRATDPDEEFHELRKRAKRARYTAELIAPIMGREVARDAGRFIHLVTEVQDTLGQLQDAVVATREIDRGLAEHANDPAFVQAAHRLLESQHASDQSARQAFFKIWNKLERKKSRRWMRMWAKAKAHARA